LLDSVSHEKAFTIFRLKLIRVTEKEEPKETGVPLSNLVSYIATNYIREEKKKKRSMS
jgi:hypothetical protein